MSSPIFPFTIKAYSTPHYTSSPSQYRDHFVRAFLESSPKGFAYFAYDAILQSATEVDFVAYDMLDSCYGGIGAKIWSGSATVPEELTREDIQKQINVVAKERREKEKALLEKRAIERHMADIIAEMNSVHDDAVDALGFAVFMMHERER